MYADRYSAGPTVKPGSLGLALAATALPLIALVVGLQIKQTLTRDQPIPVIDVHTPPPPPPDPVPPPPNPHPAAQPIDRVVAPADPVVPSPNPFPTTPDPLPLPPSPLPPGPVVADPGPPVVAMPVMVGAQVDPRYAGLLQPPYPAEELRAGREGRVELRVLIGADGRVHQVERVSAASDAFFAATERQALAKWRFKPATRDGVAIEQWKTMTVRFVMPME